MQAFLHVQQVVLPSTQIGFLYQEIGIREKKMKVCLEEGYTEEKEDYWKNIFILRW